MIYEYAIEPEFLIEMSQNIFLCQNLQQSLSSNPSTVLSSYPKQLTKEVHKKIQAKIKSSADKEKASWQEREKIITELLITIKDTPKAKRENPANSLYDEDRRYPFQGILSTNSSFIPCFSLSRGRENGCLFGLHPISVTAIRNIKEQSLAIESLLQNASEITFIDPYFFGEDRYLDIYKAYFLSISKACNIRSENGISKIAIIAAYFPHKKYSVDSEGFKNSCQMFRGVKPSNISLEIRRIQEITGQQEIHDRYIITNIGGVKFGHGTDISKDEGTISEVNISLLSREDWIKWRKAYKANSPNFDWSEHPIII